MQGVEIIHPLFFTPHARNQSQPLSLKGENFHPFVFTL